MMMKIPGVIYALWAFWMMNDSQGQQKIFIFLVARNGYSFYSKWGEKSECYICNLQNIRAQSQFVLRLSSTIFDRVLVRIAFAFLCSCFILSFKLINEKVKLRKTDFIFLRWGSWHFFKNKFFGIFLTRRFNNFY